jgi:hypothetical protein
VAMTSTGMCDCLCAKSECCEGNLTRGGSSVAAVTEEEEVPEDSSPSSNEVLSEVSRRRTGSCRTGGGGTGTAAMVGAGMWIPIIFGGGGRPTMVGKALF